MDLRKQYHSYSYINVQTGVAKSTLGVWLKDIDFYPNKATLRSIHNSQKQIIYAKRVDKIKSIIKAREFASKISKNISEEDLFFFRLGIYVGEGSKTNNILRISNKGNKKSWSLVT